MKKALKFGSPVMTIALFAVAGILLFGSSIGGARAALTYFSETYSSSIQMYDIGVTLNENGNAVARRDYETNSDGKWIEGTGALLVDRWSDENPFLAGKAYDEAISATNSGSIDEYVRVSLYTYWVQVDGQNEEKLTDRSPDLINWHLVNLGNDWLLDEAASTPERRVLYYNKILKIGETTPAVTDTLTVNGDANAKVTQRVEGNRIITSYDYDGVEFRIEAVVDAVQTHNAEDAIWSAWGRRVRVNNNGILSLN